MIIILIILLILFFSAYFSSKNKLDNIGLNLIKQTPTPSSNDYENNVLQETEEVSENKIELALKYFLDNLDVNSNLWCFRIFNFFYELEEKTSNENDPEILIGYNSFKLPQNLINIIRQYPKLDLDIKKCGTEVEKEIKEIIINTVNDQDLDSFMNTLEYISEIFFKNDTIIEFSLCGKTYEISNKLNNTLNYLKGDKEISPILYKLSLKKQECMNLI